MNFEENNCYPVVSHVVELEISALLIAPVDPGIINDELKGSTGVTALTVERSSLTSVDRSFDDSTKLSALVASSENFLWGYELKQPPVERTLT